MGSSGALTTKRPVGTVWCTPADISGGASETVQSNTMVHDFSTIPSFADAWVEFEFTQVRTSGESGSCSAWVILLGGQSELVSTDNANASDRYTLRLIANDIPQIRRGIIKLPVIQSTFTFSSDRLSIAVRGTGSAPWEVTGIKSRLVYIPL